MCIRDSGAVDQDVAAGAGRLAGVDESLQLVDDVYNIYDSPLSRSLPFYDRISEFRVQGIRHVGRNHLPDVSAELGNLLQ